MEGKVNRERVYGLVIYPN